MNKRYGVHWPLVGSVWVEVELPEGATEEEILEASRAELASDTEPYLEWDVVEHVNQGNMTQHPHPDVDIKELRLDKKD